MGIQDRTCSIVIPVYNDKRGLRTTVDSLLHQTYDRLEIVVADNGSTDGTIDLARSFASRNGVILVVEDDIQGSYAARNAGIEAASGDIIGFLDADMWVEPDYVESITSIMDRENRSYMGCRVDIVGEDTIVARYNAATGFPVKRYVESARFAPTCCLVVRKSLIDHVGKFDERLYSGGDVEFGRRVDEAGYELHYEPSVTLFHPARATFTELIAKRRRTGRGKQQLKNRHPDRFEQHSLWNPRNYLPVSPWGLESNLQSKPASHFEFVSWWVIATTLKYAHTLGRIEGLFGKR